MLIVKHFAQNCSGADPVANASALDAEIDTAVEVLYGLTPEERGAVHLR